jgi:hypothetical protein
VFGLSACFSALSCRLSTAERLTREESKLSSTFKPRGISVMQMGWQRAPLVSVTVGNGVQREQRGGRGLLVFGDVSLKVAWATCGAENRSSSSEDIAIHRKPSLQKRTLSEHYAVKASQ